MSRKVLDIERPFHIEQYLQLLAQGEDPPDILNDVVQLWRSDGTETGNDGDLYIKIHTGGDPGTNLLFKIVDSTSATFFGVEEAVTAAATIELISGAYNLVTCTLDQDVTFNITGGTAGQRLYFVLTQDGIGDHTITFGTNFNSSGDRIAPAGEKVITAFIYDGVEWLEIPINPSTIGEHGDIIYRGIYGYEVLTAELGSGFLVLNSRGPGFPPVWLDVLALIQFVTGGESVAFVFLLDIPIPSISISTVVSSAANVSVVLAPSVPIPSMSIGTSVNSDTPASYTATSSVPISSITTSTQVIP